MRTLSLVLMLAYRDMRVRYKRAWLGMLWSLATPLALAFVFTIIFRIVFGAPIPRYPLYVLAGLYPWMYFQRALLNATHSFQMSSEIIRQIPVNKAAIPLAEVLVEALHLAGALILLCMLTPFLGGVIGLHWFELVPVFVTTVSITAGIAMILAPLQARYRDTKYIIELVLLLLIYAAPIIYSPEMAPAEMAPWIVNNPVSFVITPYQRVFYHGEYLPARDWMMLSFYALLSVGVGYAVISRLGRNAADYV